MRSKENYEIFLSILWCVAYPQKNDNTSGEKLLKCGDNPFLW